MKTALLTDLLRRNPIVVTGCGIVSSAGLTPDAVWHSASSGISTAKLVEHQTHLGVSVFPECAIDNVVLPNEYQRLTRKMGRSARLGMLAALNAWQQAHPTGGLMSHPERGGIMVGTSRGALDIMLDLAGYDAIGRHSPSLSTSSTIAGLSGVLAQAFHLQGPCLTVSSACTSFTTATLLAAQQLLTEVSEIMLVGAVEVPLLHPLLEQLNSAGLLGSHAQPKKTCRPFDITRNGTVPGEGSAFLVLETEASARQRNATILACLAGWAVGSEARARASMENTGEQMSRIISQALTMAEMAPSDIGYINLHGTGTYLNDLVESRAVGKVWGEISQQPWCSSTKPITGHCMGASAAIEAVIALQALKHQMAPPSINCFMPDPDCAIRLVRDVAQPFKQRAVMSNSAGLWGNLGCLVFSAA